MAGSHSPSRRRLLQTLGISAFGATAAGPLRASILAPRRPEGLELTNLHTNETVEIALPANAPLDKATQLRLQRVLRDHRSGDEHEIDAALFTQLVLLAGQAGAEGRYEIISGYRSPQTNAAMHERSSGVASRSLHMEGRALDVRLKGVDCLKLAELARLQQQGGVGYYPKSKFVHLDTGRVRTWDG